MPGAVRNLLPIRGKEGSAVIAQCMREPLQVATTHVHRVDVQVAVAQRGEHDRLAVRRERALSVIAGVGGDATCPLAVGGRDVDVVVVQRPDISFGIVGTRRARRTGMLGGGIEDAACPPRPDYSKGYVWALY